MNNIGDEGAIALSHNPNLKELDVSMNNISDIGGSALSKITSLESLALGSNQEINSKTAIALLNNSVFTSCRVTTN